MAYSKQTWSDREIEKPNTYQVVENQDETVTLVPKPGQVTNEGTKVTAARMNHIEDGIDGAVCKSGDTMTGNLTIQTSHDPAIMYRRADGTLRGYTLISEDNRYIVIQKHLDDGNLDLYYFPIVNSGSSAGYDVLTTKSPVTIAQGGNGATTADGARTNLDVYSKGETDAAIAKYMLCDTDNKQTFTFENLSLLNDTGKYKYGLLFGGEPAAPFVYHVFAAVDNTITITPILSNSNSVTFTGSVSGTTLTLTGNRIAYGGVRLIWINS